ncbi:MAG: nitroreductase family deazaflavin-dependent oxidoreductase [Chloroflexota bacterium]|nr:nitroreductase family deazaflavin-dependent oxidoreductase [Chloroflexota bacterium]
MTVPELLAAHADDSVLQLQTIGRTSGRPRTIEIWFSTDGERVYLLAGGRDGAHWVRNLRAEPRVRLRIGGQTLDGRARVIEGEANEPVARRMLAAKYQGWREGSPLSAWAAGSLPVEITPD